MGKTERTKEQALKAIRDLVPKTTIKKINGGTELKIKDAGTGKSFNVPLNKPSLAKSNTSSFR
jgi:hypothetical protein